jgi:hypothetical protein
VLHCFDQHPVGVIRAFQCIDFFSADDERINFSISNGRERGLRLFQPLAK